MGDPQYIRCVSDEDEKAIDDALGLEIITMRFDKEVLKRIKDLAKQEGLIPLAYIRRLVIENVEEATGWKKMTRSSGLRFPKYKWICECGANIWDENEQTDRACDSCGSKRERWCPVDGEEAGHDE